MPEARDLPLSRWGEEIRRNRVARREQRSRSAAAAVAAFTVTALVASLLWQPRPLLVWNASASAPLGLYAVSSLDDVRAGEMVIAWTPEPSRSLARLAKRAIALACEFRKASHRDRFVIFGRN